MGRRFLVDAQLPPALARFLAGHGHEARHVVDVGLERATDAAIWAWAQRHEAAILTKDEDFAQLAVLRPEGPPVVWVRIGNTTRQELLRSVAVALDAVVQALERGERLVELR